MTDKMVAMEMKNAVSWLMLASLGLLGTVILAVGIGWTMIQAGLGQAAGYGAGIFSALLAVLAMVGVGTRKNQATVDTNVNVDPQQIEVQIQEGNLQKETSPRRADFPEWSAAVLRRFRDWGISYSLLQNVLKFGIVVGTFIMIPFAVALITYGFGVLGANVPPELITYGEQVITTLGFQSTLIGAAMGMLVATFAFVGFTGLNEVHDKTTCNICGDNYCLTFEYALYHPQPQEEHTTTEYDEENSPVGTRTTGYAYKGTLYATCTTRDEMVEIEDWNWYVSTG